MRSKVPKYYLCNDFFPYRPTNQMAKTCDEVSSFLLAYYFLIQLFLLYYHSKLIEIDSHTCVQDCWSQKHRKHPQENSETNKDILVL